MFVAVLWTGARAAALVPVPAPPQPPAPVPGLEANRGQAKAGILFLIPESSGSIAVTAQSVLYSPVGVSLSLVASNPNPTVSPSDLLPGVNYYTGADPHKWVSRIQRYGTADLAGVYPGINAEYTIGSDGTLTLNLLLSQGTDPKAVQFQIAPAALMMVNPDGSLTARLGPG